VSDWLKNKKKLLEAIMKAAPYDKPKYAKGGMVSKGSHTTPSGLIENHYHVSFPPPVHHLQSPIPPDKLEKYSTRVLMHQSKKHPSLLDSELFGKPLPVQWDIHIRIIRSPYGLSDDTVALVGRHTFLQYSDPALSGHDPVHAEFYDRTTGELLVELRGVILTESVVYDSYGTQVTLFGNECLCANSDTLFG